MRQRRAQKPQLAIPFEKWWPLAQRPFENVSPRLVARQAGITLDDAQWIEERALALRAVRNEPGHMDNFELMIEVGAITRRVVNALMEKTAEVRILTRAPYSPKNLGDLSLDA